MIIPRLKGGLCNQLFTIAAAYSRALDINAEFAINYSLPHYGGQGKPPIFYKNTLFSKIAETDSVPINVYTEKDWSYSPITAVDDSLLDGYFQSYSHFEKNIDKVKELLAFPEETITKINKGLSKLSKKKLGIHVRLGDYLHPTYSSTHLICDRNYYLTALKEFNLNEYDIIVCTDDIDNYQRFINIENAIIGNTGNEIDDLYLLSQCDDLILTNSSFSCWSSYLGKVKNKVCVPSRWFGIDGPKNYESIYRDSWTKIKV